MHRSVQLSMELQLTKSLTNEINPNANKRKENVSYNREDTDIDTHISPTIFVKEVC